MPKHPSSSLMLPNSLRIRPGMACGYELRIVPHVPGRSAEPARPICGMSLRSETVGGLLPRWPYFILHV